MNSTRWDQTTSRALEWREGEPIEPVLEALALVLARSILGELPDERVARRLISVGRRALLRAGGSASDEDDDEILARQLAADLAREGLRVLSGEAWTVADTFPPSAREIVRLRSRDIDGFEAAMIARRVRGSDRARRELALLDKVVAPVVAPPRIRLAADSHAVMLDPKRGRPLVVLRDEGGRAWAEVFAFADQMIAVYTRDAVPVRLQAEEARTLAMQPGYWAGAVSAERVRGRLHVGERTVEVEFSTGEDD